MLLRHDNVGTAEEEAEEAEKRSLLVKSLLVSGENFLKNWVASNK